MKNITISGFTLVEMSIAVAAGSAIVLIAASGFRVASLALTKASLLTNENTLVTNGILAAFDELDDWNSFDNIRDTSPPSTQRILRNCHTVSTAGDSPSTLSLGLPFSPFSSRSPMGPTVTSWEYSTGSFGGGWEDDERLWIVSANNRLLSMTDSIMETSNIQTQKLYKSPYQTDFWLGLDKGFNRFGRHGYFGISYFTNSPTSNYSVLLKDGDYKGGNDQTCQFYQYSPRPPSLPIGSNGRPPDSLIESYRSSNLQPGWIFNKIRGLGNSLGWYGRSDYLPQNTIYSYIRDFFPRNGWASSTGIRGEYTSRSGRPVHLSFIDDNSPNEASKNITDLHGPVGESFYDGGFYFNNLPWSKWEDRSQIPRSFDSFTGLNCFAILPWSASPYLTASNLIKEYAMYHRMTATSSNMEAFATFSSNGTRSNVNGGENGSGDSLAYFNRCTGQTRLMPVKPITWNDITITANHYLMRYRYCNQASVSWFNPNTGESAEIRFTALGTTLRGARRQRGLDL